MALNGLVDDEQLRVLQMTVAAIGGVEEDENGNVQYVKGDECTGTLVRSSLARWRAAARSRTARTCGGSARSRQSASAT